MVQRSSSLIAFVGAIFLLQSIIVAAFLLPADVFGQALSLLQNNEPSQRLPVANLLQGGAFVIHGQVIHSESSWSADHTIIETEHLLNVYDAVPNQQMRQIRVRTEGGFLPQEDLGMVSSHTPQLLVGEEVLLFLNEASHSYRVVKGELGKYSIINGVAYNGKDAIALADLRQKIDAELVRQQRLTVAPLHPPLDVKNQRLQIQPKAQPWQMVERKWPLPNPVVKVKVNINTNQAGGANGSVDDFRNAIRDSLIAWSTTGVVSFTLLYDSDVTTTTTGFDGVNEILFMHKGANSLLGQAQIWFTSDGTILEGDIWINDDYTLDASGAPGVAEADLESAILHEVGHWLPLVHDPNNATVMYAALTLGTQKRTLHANDIAAFATRYPCSNPPCIHPDYEELLPTATAIPLETPIDTQPTLTSTMTPTAPDMPTATSTPTPTTTPPVSGTPHPAGTPEPSSDVFLPIVQW